ncbi:hypothetical protein WT11_05270 [Burkholderia stagnalis]|uniref:hypothetical protein n=1 Tax=Burkholderia stagnalis TaxID=1503054 RepID=UPI000755FABB|nr:hypothetical protein [Burkholderia stagnalis]KVN38329.1 hypothetical protein WT11_05270 [Burkholderia stagnalis]
MKIETKSKIYAAFAARINIPIFGHIFKCKWKDVWDSFVEYSNSLLWSTMPFWLGALVLFYQQQNGDKSFVDTLTGTFRNGELLVFTIGAVTPITYLTLFEDPKAAFPHRLSLGTLAMFLIVICASLFALQKGKVTTKTDLIYYTSLIFAAVAITLRYISILYNKTKYPVTTENDLVRPAQVFFEEFEMATDETVSTQQSGPGAAQPTEQDEFSKRFSEATSGEPDNDR